jgi:Peptidase family S41
MRALAVAALALVLAGCAGDEKQGPPTPLQREIRGLVDDLVAFHPDVDHQVPLRELRAEANDLAARAPELSRDELVVGLLRLTTLGERDGHGGIFLHDPAHTRPFHFFPLRVHDFADGVHVVAEPDGTGHVGKRVLSVDGVPIDDVVERVKPLIPHDNDSTVRLLLPEYVVCAEVLRGLGIVEGAATYGFADGSEVTLDPVGSSEYAGTLGTAFAPLPMPGDPLQYRGLDQSFLLEPLEGGRSLYLGYRHVVSPPQELLDSILATARRTGFHRLVIDARYNGGGDNTTYWPLIELLQTGPLKQRGTVAVLLGRMTFSAAGNFAASVDHETNAILVGEPSGGAPNQWGDRIPIELPRAGLTAYVAAEWVEVAPGDTRLAVEPDVPVEPTAADVLAGRDPVLARALTLP